MDVVTSDGSYNSDCSDSDKDFYYIDEVLLPQIKKVGFEVGYSEEINLNLKQEIRFLNRDIEFWLFNNLDMGDYFSIFYAAQIYEKSLKIEQDFGSRKLEYFEAK